MDITLFTRLAFLIVISSTHNARTQSTDPTDIDNESDAPPTSDDNGNKAPECISFAVDGGRLERITPSSKYLLFQPDSTDAARFKASDADNTCNQVGSLQVGEVHHEYDLISLKPMLTTSVWLGINHKETAGKFVYGSGGRLEYQTFVGMEPNNGGGSERCVVLHPLNGFLAMEDVGCSSADAAILCQYKRGTSCYTESAEEIANIRNPMAAEVTLLPGGGGDTQFFVSVEQRSWARAHEVCMRNGMLLVKLDNETRFQEMVDQIKKHIGEQNLNPHTQFWTAGSTTGGSMHWNVGEELTELSETLVSHEWAQAGPDEMEPMDQSGSGLENCLDISFENTELTSKGSHTPLWRMSNCFLPKYFICEQNVPVIPIEWINQTITNDSITGSDNGDGTDKVNCKITQVDPLNFEIGITNATTAADIVKFIIFNIENDLTNGTAPFEIKKEIEWKMEVIDILVEITKKAVASQYVDHGLLNVVKVLNLVYQNAVVNEEDTESERIWKKRYIPHLWKCLNYTQMLDVLGTGYEITTVKKTEEDETTIQVSKEYADNSYYLDSSIDILWFMFSFAMGNCYNLPADKLTFASDLHVIFVKDFIDKLRARWTLNVNITGVPGEQVLDYRIALGDVDFDVSMRNLRHIVKAAYMINEIEDIELVRPLDLTTIFTDVPVPIVKENGRTGENLYAEVHTN